MLIIKKRILQRCRNWDSKLLSGAYELLKEHEILFYKNPNYVTMFEI